uniref:Uncharacterized protein n=1 Tax=Strongyloides venezuelensis TaxID=75913 RepID=A0A0K0G1K2_STRVS
MKTLWDFVRRFNKTCDEAMEGEIVSETMSDSSESNERKNQLKPHISRCNRIFERCRKPKFVAAIRNC